jgi:ribA/ribD-fused uncharacterized protein
MPDIIWGFQGDSGFLSNFYQSDPILAYGKSFKTGEHLFNALKTTDPAEAQLVIDAPTPAKAKWFGRRVTLKPNWDESGRFIAMRATLGAKFIGNEYLTTRLLLTKDYELWEANTWHDNFWGVCICQTCEKSGLKGENHLGKMLMELRTDLRKWSLTWHGGPPITPQDERQI